MIIRQRNKVVPSYHQGFGTYQDSQAPDLWRGNILAMAPFLGPSGTRLFEWSVRGNHGAITGPAWAAGDLVFPGGSGDFITIPDTDVLSFGDGSTDTPFSIAVGFKFDSTNRVLFSKGSPAQREYNMGINATPILSMSLFDDIASVRLIRRSATTLSAGVEYHVVFTYNAAENPAGMHIYLDGALDDGTTVDNGSYVGMHNQPQPAYIGANVGVQEWDGTIFYFYVWDRVISNTEILSIYRDPFIMFREIEAPMVSAPAVTPSDWNNTQAATADSNILQAAMADSNIRQPATSDWNKTGNA
jgi:hypothetical protein